jgi:two-component system sensor histidine kinase HydH
MTKPTRYSLLLALLYCLVASVYIVFSGRIAAQLATSVEDLRHIEQVKGILYVAVTTVAVFVGGWFAMRRIDRTAEELGRRERALIVNEGRVMAGLMAASVAHDANNVLQSVIGHLSMIEPGTSKGVLGELRGGVERLVGLNRRLVSRARGADSGELQEIGLTAAARQTLEGIHTHANVRSRRVALRGDDSVMVIAHPLLLEQVMTNLLLNACEATREGGSVDLVVSAAGDDAVLEVDDDGPGIPVERRANLFDALTTTKSSGSGLGLFSVRACVQAMGGEVEVGDSPLGGARFRVRLARKSNSAAAQPSLASAPVRRQ